MSQSDLVGRHQPVHEIVDFATTGNWLCEKCGKTWGWNTPAPAKCTGDKIERKGDGDREAIALLREVFELPNVLPRLPDDLYDRIDDALAATPNDTPVRGLEAMDGNGLHCFACGQEFPDSCQCERPDVSIKNIRAALTSKQTVSVDREGWQPISAAKPRRRYMAAFRAPLQRDVWEIVGPGSIRDGIFRNYLGEWPCAEMVFELPPVASSPSLDGEG